MWITPNVDSLKTVLSDKEFDLVQAAALAAGQSDPLPQILARIIRTVRAKVSGAGNKLGDGQTIPDELEDATLAIFRYNALTRFPNLKSLLDQNRVDANAAAIRELNNLKGMAIEAPEEVTTEKVGPPGPKFKARERVLSREHQNG